MGSFSSEAFPQEIWDWAFNDLIPKVAAKYRGVERPELVAQLRATLLEIQRGPHKAVRNWQAYLAQCLRRRASRLAKRSRKHREREPSIEVTSPLSEPAEEQETPASLPTTEQTLASFRRRLGNADRRLLKQLEQCGGNVSCLARRLGCHRNTIHRHLRRIRRTRCPIEIESAPLVAGLPEPSERVQLVSLIQSPSASARQILRARVISALIDGFSYDDIRRALGTSHATIARWRGRFEERGVAGLNSHHPGKKPPASRARLIKHLRQTRQGERPSARELARQFGFGKSTAHRVLKLVGNGAHSSGEAL